jgi:hypothetical protein
MRRISFVLCVMSGALWASTVSAQCRGMSGATTGTTAALSGGSTASTGSAASALLTSPGSWYHDMLLAQAMQRQLAQRQYLLAMQQQAARQQQLEARRYRAEQQREATLAGRERNRQRLLAASSSATPVASQYAALDSSGRR